VAAVGALARALARAALKLRVASVHTGTVTMTAGTAPDTDHQASLSPYKASSRPVTVTAVQVGPSESWHTSTSS